MTDDTPKIIDDIIAPDIPPLTPEQRELVERLCPAENVISLPWQEGDLLEHLQSQPYERQLADLLAGPFAGHGGKVGLSRELGIPISTLQSYLQPVGNIKRREPGFAHENRQRIRNLWEIRKGGVK